ncbi:MAG: lipid II:glycine glycyltransferase FemX [Candidatus Helarchaeota archaeon]
MSDYQIIEDPKIELWNSFLCEFPDGNFRQSFEYGEISKKAFSSLRVVRLAIVDEGGSDEYTGIIQGEYSSHFGFGMTLGAMMGPLVDRKRVNTQQLVENLLKELEDYGRKNRVICIRIWVPENWGMGKLLDILGYTEVGKFNGYIVDFGNGIEDLWKNIDHNKRRNIKKAMKEKVEVYQSHDYEDLKTFYSMLEAARERGGFSTYPLSWYSACWEIYPRELSRVFLACWRDKVVSGVFTIIHGNTVYSMGAGSFKEGWEARPNDILHWKVMEWACENGYNKYHMGLVSEPPPVEGSNEWGVWRWKREWRGNLEKIRVYEKVLLPRYKLILKAKELAESGYNRLRRLI